MRRTSVSNRNWAVKLAALALAGAGLTQQLAAQPANNSCANAIPVAAGSISGTTIGATNDGAGTCGNSAGSPDVWYRYIAPFDGQLTVETCGGAGWDTVLGVWDGCPSAGGTEIGCVDDACGVQTSLTVFVDNAEEYWIRVAGFSGSTGTFTLTISDSEGGGPPPGSIGPDVVYSDITDVAQYGPVGNVYAYAFGTGTCNIGDINLHWGFSWAGSPAVGFNAYRLHDGRLMQLGQSWCKVACCAAAGNGCGIGCNGQGGSVLGVGCRDTYGAFYNGSQGNLSKRSSINPFTGAQSIQTGSGSEIFARLQIPASDITAANFPGAQYFGEGVYVSSDDAPAHNSHNNASYRRMTLGAGFSLVPSGATVVGTGAIYAWRDHGLGVNIPDPSVTVEPLDIPEEGRFIVAHRARDLGDGTWRYDYAIFNINSDRAGGSLTLPIPAGTTITNTGFHDVNYHSGEPYDNTDWTITVGADSITWASPQTFAQNPNSNALRWGTMYNFWFDANRPPATAPVTLGLFKPHTPQSVTFTGSVPSAPPSGQGDLDGDGDIDLTDLAMMLSDFGCNAPSCVGDLNDDGVTDIGDLAILLANFGT
jgi:hypothetical protein